MDSSPQKAQPPMPPRCIKCFTTLMPNADACPNCGRPAPPKSALTQERDMDRTQFVHIAPGDLLPEDKLPEDKLPVQAAVRRSLILAVLLGLLAGALLLLVMANLPHARH